MGVVVELETRRNSRYRLNVGFQNRTFSEQGSDIFIHEFGDIVINEIDFRFRCRANE